MAGITYKDSGVDIHAGEDSVKDISKLARQTFNEQVVRDIGLFGSFYRLNMKNIEDPILVSSVDGVGTKLKIAFLAGIHDTVGEDLVNHCVNDIMTSGADPMFFLDYLAVSKLKGKIITNIVAGMARGCKNNNCALIGGETAEMPDFYQPGEYDISGMIVGLLDGKKIIDGSKIQKGDILLGLPSNGLHTNGYSMVRKIFFELSHYKVEDYIEEFASTLGEELLRVHRSYRETILALKDEPYLHGMSHITGGGIVGNTKRVLPEKLGLNIDWESWEPPEIFQVIQQLGKVEDEEMRHVFNMGIGYIFIVERYAVHKAVEILNQLKQQPIIIGEVK